MTAWMESDQVLAWWKNPKVKLPDSGKPVLILWRTRTGPEYALALYTQAGGWYDAIDGSEYAAPGYWMELPGIPEEEA